VKFLIFGKALNLIPKIRGDSWGYWCSIVAKGEFKEAFMKSQCLVESIKNALTFKMSASEAKLLRQLISLSLPPSTNMQELWVDLLCSLSDTSTHRESAALLDLHKVMVAMLELFKDTIAKSANLQLLQSHKSVNIGNADVTKLEELQKMVSDALKNYNSAAYGTEVYKLLMLVKDHLISSSGLKFNFFFFFNIFFLGRMGELQDKCHEQHTQASSHLTEVDVRISELEAHLIDAKNEKKKLEQELIELTEESGRTDFAQVNFYSVFLVFIFFFVETNKSIFRTSFCLYGKECSSSS
jgi:hypothetical protein